jgi:hypothetical protein
VKPPYLTCRALRSPAFSFKGLATDRPLGARRGTAKSRPGSHRGPSPSPLIPGPQKCLDPISSLPARGWIRRVGPAADARVFRSRRARSWRPSGAAMTGSLKSVEISRETMRSIGRPAGSSSSRFGAVRSMPGRKRPRVVQRHPGEIGTEPPSLVTPGRGFGCAAELGGEHARRASQSPDSNGSSTTPSPA